MRNGSLLRTPVAVVAGLALALAGCSQRPNYTPPEAGAENNFLPAESVVRSTGSVVPEEFADLSFPISGLVTEVAVEEGDSVQAGDVIARMDTYILEADVARAEAVLKAAEANLERVKLGASEAEILAAQSALAAIGAPGNPPTPESPAQAAQLAAAQAQLDYLLSLPLPEDLALAEAQVEQAQTDVEAARARLQQAVLSSHLDGTVTELFVNPYEYVMAGEPVVQISDLSTLHVDTELTEADVARIAIGDRAIISFGMLAGVEVGGTVTRIAAKPSQDHNAAFTVTVTLDEIPENLRWGMTAYVDILLE